MIHQFRNRNFYLLIGIDTIVFVVSLFLAYDLRFIGLIPHLEFHLLVMILPWVIGVKLTTFFLMGVYRGMWRYTSLEDAMCLLRASLLASAIILSGLMLFNRSVGYPRSVFVADCIFTLFFCGGVRAGIRLTFSAMPSLFSRWKSDASPSPRQGRLLIIGAGNSTDKLIREVRERKSSPYQIVCCLDDDKAKQHRSMLGIHVYGPISRLAHFAERFKATEVVISMPSVSGDRLRSIIAICEKSGLPYKTLPSLGALIDGDVTINDLRPVNIEDLLGRPPVTLDTLGIGQYLTHKTVVVTGAGGSIGSELCRQIIRFMPATLVLIDASEFNLYHMEMELRKNPEHPEIVPVLGHVQDRPLMENVFARHRPQVVFHAAAYKHVPMVELNPWQAVTNNVLGSQTIMDTAEKFEVERCVMISSDKAVRPTNVMGATKRTAEILLQSRPAGKTCFMAVRFGNVLGSSGSVIPLFTSQIKAGGPVTVTDPEMTRYFMTIPEACQLVLQTGALGTGGEIFILEMGTPVRIDDLARDLIRLSGKEPELDVAIIYTGLRPGEKLFEELITHGEGIVPTAHHKIMVLRPNGNANASHYAQCLTGLDQLVAEAGCHDAPKIKLALQRLVPEYVLSASPSVLCGVPSRVTAGSECEVDAGQGRDRQPALDTGSFPSPARHAG